VVTTWDPSSDTVEDTGVLDARRSIVLRGRITRPTQYIGEMMWSARNRRDRIDVMIECIQIIVMGWSRVRDVKIGHGHHARIDTVDTISSLSDMNTSTSSSWCACQRSWTTQRTCQNPDLESKSRSRVASGMSRMIARISQCVVTEAVVAEVGHVASRAVK
jgi:hypothetical protein